MLTVSGQGEHREVPLDASGAVIGRNAKCDVVLDSDRVSRQHARIFQDPFGRWIVEDLGSRNGVRIGGARIEAHAVSPGDEIAIGPFALALSEPLDHDIPPDPSSPSTTAFIEGAVDFRVSEERAASGVALSRASLKELNDITDRLAELTAPSQLYPEVCRSLAADPKTAALVLRLPGRGEPLPPTLQVLACHLGGRAQTARADADPNLHLSRRVLEAARSSGEPVMAANEHAGDEELSLTIGDAGKPRAVLCAPVGEQTDSLDALYLDVPLDQAAGDLFQFVQAVTRQVRFARKSLLLLEAKAERRVLDQQLALARRIQARLMPSSIPQVPGVDVAVYYEPAMWVGGDYCDVWVLPDGRLCFVVADVSGKGLPAAMVMTNLQAALRTAISLCPGPSDAMDHVNRHLLEHLPDNMFVTLFLGLFEPRSARLEYVNAGHVLPVLIGPDGGVSSLGPPSNPILGVLEDPFVTDVETIGPGAGLLIVTDGITESTAEDREQFGCERLEQLMQTTGVQSAQQMVEMTTEAATRFRDLRPQQDDTTVLALRNRGHDDQ